MEAERLNKYCGTCGVSIFRDDRGWEYCPYCEQAIKFQDQIKSLRSSMSAANEAREKAEAALCRAREALKSIKDDEQYAGDTFNNQVQRMKQKAEDALSSTAPCPHAAEVEALRNSGSPWPTVDVLDKLSAFAMMMLRERDYSGDGWESVHAAAQEAQIIIGKLRRAGKEKP